MASVKKQGGSKVPAPAVALPKSSRGLKGFFSDVSREMKKVTWPQHREVTRLSLVVLGMCLLCTIALLVEGKVADVALQLIENGYVRSQ